MKHSSRVLLLAVVLNLYGQQNGQGPLSPPPAPPAAPAVKPPAAPAVKPPAAPAVKPPAAPAVKPPAAPAVKPPATPAVKQSTVAPPPAPVKTVELYSLPGFCTFNDQPTHNMTSTCPAAAHVIKPVQAENAPAIVAALAREKQFSFLAYGNSQIVIFSSGSPTDKDKKRIESIIDSLSQPPNSLIEPYKLQLPSSGSAADVADKINRLFGPRIGAVALPGDRLVQITSSSAITPAELATLKAMTQPSSASTVAIDLPFFCISRRLSGPPPRVIAANDACNPTDERLKVQGSTASAISAALAKDKTFTVTAPAKTRILASCSTPPCSDSDIEKIIATVMASAWPSPAYTEDVDVPSNAASEIAAELSSPTITGITAEVIGRGKVRLSSDTPVSDSDVAALTQQYLFGGQPPPLFRMFYQDPTKEVAAIAPPPGSPTPASGTGSAAPATAAAASPITFTTKSETSTSGTPSATAASTTSPPAAAGAPDSTTPAPVTTTSTTTTYTPPPQPPPAPAPAKAAPPPVGKDMAAAVDNVVFTDTSNEDLVWQRVRLLTLLDLPRPEVLMNVWSYEASSPNGKDVLQSAQNVRDLVSAHNDALENSIEYGWAYLSREMKNDRLHKVVETDTTRTHEQGTPVPGRDRELRKGGLPSESAQTLADPDNSFFEHDFYDYITQKFVGDPQGTLDERDRASWGFCPVGKFCLGFTDAFQPVRPNLTSILLGAIASRQPLKTILTTIGCMEGKYEVYPNECFPERQAIDSAVWSATHESLKFSKQDIADSSRKIAPATLPSKTCADCKENVNKLENEVEKAESLPPADKCSDCQREQLDLIDRQKLVDPYAKDLEIEKKCLRSQRRRLAEDKRYKGRTDCEALDAIALEAQETCGIVQTFPLSCFTIQSAQSFNSHTAFSTFTIQELNELAEEPIANKFVVSDGEDLPKKSQAGTTRVGLLRAAVADFLFNYKMSQEFPRDFTPYDLQHSAQELNAELNPLVVAFNQDVAAYSRHLSDKLDIGSRNQNNFFEVWRNRKSFLSDGIITVRGIGGDASTVDTLTQNFFDATQAQSLSDVLNKFTGQGSASAGGSASSPSASVLAALEKGTMNPTTAIAALAAITPQATQAKIGRQLTFNVTPHTLPGASSAELEVELIAGESADASLYQQGNATALTDSTSRVAHHNVTTRVRVESVKMFELSSFSALVQRPRSRIPLVPPLIELPWIGNFASIPLPGAKEYHRSTAIVSAIIVPTAADLAYGISFAHDRLMTGVKQKCSEADTLAGCTWGREYRMQSVLSLSQFTGTPIRAFHKAMVNCFATNTWLINLGGVRRKLPDPPEPCRLQVDFRTVPPEF